MSLIAAVDALKFLRSQNIIHRDIKPQNLLLQPPDSASLARGHPVGIPVLRVADFGFARFLPQASMADTLCGSPCVGISIDRADRLSLYMAPEILRYEKYDAKVDLWSVGAVLFEMVVGKPPFRAQNHVELLRKIERGEDRIKFPDERSAARTPLPDGTLPTPPLIVPDDLKALIRGLLKRKPSERMTWEAFFDAADIVSTSGAAAALRRPRDAEGGGSVTRSTISPGPVPLVTPEPASGSQEGAFVRPSARPRGDSTVTSRPSPHERAASTPAVPSTAAPSMARRTPSFAPKYVVGSSSRENVAEASRRPSPPADEAIAAFARPMHGLGPPARLPRVDPTVADDDSVLGREYVVVEKRTVEINALADGA